MKSLLSLRGSFKTQQLAEGALVAMIVGLFFSRALLSVAMGVFFLSAPLRLGVRQWLSQASRHRGVWIFGALWLLPVVSGLWSEDLRTWSDVIRIKLPLLLLPMGWVGLDLNKQSLHRIGWILVSFTFLGAVYSLLPLWGDFASVKASYQRGGSLPTPLENDRVRFSWLIVAACWWLQGEWQRSFGAKRIWIALIGGFFIVFLHVLAVRIGLLCLYMLIAFLLVRLSLEPIHRKWSLPLFLGLLCLPLIMYWTVPTFRSRIDYIRYDWSYTLQGNYLPGGNDAIRVQSLQASAAVIRNHPLHGVGFGDIRSAMDAVYQQINPMLTVSERIYPANEWAVYGVGAGWLGVLIFSGLMIGLFFYPSSDPFRGRSWALATIATFVTDIGLEVQYGVFLVPFLMLFFQSADRMKIQEIRN